ncbi:zinc-ribbon domain-containing protein [Methanobrevibacter sp. UBA46]|uniref:zinc-ribbon domain-containing protein n=1 Tax=Methanobrevibacter sp. UBA46 TaxID=1915488 RepID=UPI0039B9A135
MVIYCGNCNYPNKDNAKKCINCGYEFTEIEEIEDEEVYEDDLLFLILNNLL